MKNKHEKSPQPVKPGNDRTALELMVYGTQLDQLPVITASSACFFRLLTGS